MLSRARIITLMICLAVLCLCAAGLVSCGKRLKKMDPAPAAAPAGEVAAPSEEAAVSLAPPTPSAPPAAAVEMESSIQAIASPKGEMAASVARAKLAAPMPRQAPPPAMGMGGDPLAPVRPPSAMPGTDSFDHVEDNPFLAVDKNPLSTFSIDVDTASYAITRRMLQNGQQPPKGAVRVEEFINYFDYEYPEPTDGKPFAAHVETAECPWAPGHRLARIGIQGDRMDSGERKPANLVFLLDVSGSMAEPDKLPLVQQAMRVLPGKLESKDKVAIVVYAGNSGVVLPPTSCSEENRTQIENAIAALTPGGSTHGSGGIVTAYELARQGFIKKGVNRVILATDGDFNVGVTDQSSLVELVQKEAKSGVFLTVLGFGMGNLKDSTMELLADKGNGNYGYIDSFSEAKKMLGRQFLSTTVAIAKDVKIQVEFNPAAVGAYRLIGYENRVMRAEDFNDDTKDAGEIGAGHTVTALYEITPPGDTGAAGNVDPLRFKGNADAEKGGSKKDLLWLKLRYKEPEGEKSALSEFLIKNPKQAETVSGDFSFQAAVAAFGMLLRESPHKGKATFAMVEELAEKGLYGKDEGGLRREFINLTGLAKDICRAEK